MMKTRTWILAAVCAVAWCGAARADLDVGDKAPKLTISKWMKGKEIDLAKADKGDVYVVEFWATWCGPCKMSIPHMSEMQEHFKDRHVTFIGVSQEKADVVKKFLEDGWDAKMRYTVAIDKEGTTNEDWMKAASKNGIPTAFVVKEGKITWIGHPMMGLDEKVADACGDKEYAEAARKFKELGEKLGGQMKDEEWDDALKTLDKMIELKPKEQSLGLNRYVLIATKKKDKTAAAKAGREFVDKCDEAGALNEFAWMMLTDENWAEAKDLKLALTAAKKALDLSNEKDAAIMDTYARALVDSGDLKTGIEWQRKAVKLAKDKNTKKELEKNLAEYEKKAGEGV